jgi:hypothetical protein
VFRRFFGSTIAERCGSSWPSIICRRFFIGAGVTIADASAGCVRFFLRPRLRQARVTPPFGTSLMEFSDRRCASGRSSGLARFPGVTLRRLELVPHHVDLATVGGELSLLGVDHRL